MPQIPDSLREEALQAQAIARFTIGVDGVVTVDWLRPTQNPVLNRLLLASLKNWKFFPALKDGKPVASTQDIVIKIQVK
jgi:protein TonB